MRKFFFVFLAILNIIFLIIPSSNYQSTNLIKVEIKGEVQKPGVYQMPLNARVTDLIKKAGNITSQANTSFNNQSKRLKDEDVIIIY